MAETDVGGCFFVRQLRRLRVRRSDVEGHALNFSTGQVVVHPHHGPAKVTKIFTRTVRGERRRYLRLDIDTELTVSLPVDQAEDLGVRDLIDTTRTHELFDILLAPSEPQDTVWSRRMKANTERLRSGNVSTVAALIRDLTRQNAEKRLSFGEMKLLREATEPFVSELAAVLATGEEKIATLLDAAILDGARPDLPEPRLATAS